MQSYSIGRIRGIDLRIHPTFGLVVLWVVYQFGISGDSTAGSLVYGLVLLAVLFACVILHELGHSLMAQEYGIRVRNITLFPFGGAAFIEQMPMRPRSEMMITLAGPAVNVAIAATLLPILFFDAVVIGSESIGAFLKEFDALSLTGVLLYIFIANIMLILFNLLPVFPMDGGRLVRAGLSQIVGRERATSVAFVLGVVGAFVMALAGIWLRSPMLPLLAISIIFAAYGEAKAVRLESAMRRLRVGQFALWDAGGISASASLGAALRGGPRDMVVTESGHVVGMLWRQDVMKAISGGVGQTTVAQVMDPQFFSVDIDDSVYDVQRQMHDVNRWAVPVTDGETYRGIFTAERFIHVYRYLNTQSPQRRRFEHLFAQVSNAFRGNR